MVQRTEGWGEVVCIKIGKNELEGIQLAGAVMSWDGHLIRSCIKRKQ